MGYFTGTLTCGVALAGLAIAQPARATLTLTVTDPNAGGGIGVCSASAQRTRDDHQNRQGARTERVEASAPMQPTLPLRLPEQRQIHDPVPEKLVRQFLRRGKPAEVR